MLERVRHVLRLDEDLSPFYEVAERDPELAWVATGAARMIRSPTVFEEIVKTVCTTNCSWGATVRMVHALVEHLGAKSPGAPRTGVEGRAFPSPQAMTEVGEDSIDVVRAVTGGGVLHRPPESVAAARWTSSFCRRLPTSCPTAKLGSVLALRRRSIPAAHVMMMLGRYSRLILDSWTRPTYARLQGKRSVKDSTIVRRWKPYGDYAGLAFWMYLTKSWVPDES